VHQFLPTSTVNIAHTPVQLYRFIIFGVGLVAVVSLTLYLRRTRTGLAMLAVVDDSELLNIAGTNPIKVRRIAWLIGTTMASASGVLIAPLVPLDATTLTFLVVTAFGAAAIGGFSNLPLTFAGGLAIGLAQVLIQKQFTSSHGLEAGLSQALPFLVLFVLLLTAPRLRRPSGATILRRELTNVWKPPTVVRLSGAAILLVVLLLVPGFAGIHIGDWTRFLAYGILFLSLGLLVRVSGQVSLAHMSFMAIGAAAFSHFAVGGHLPWIAAVLLAGAVAAPVGAILAIPAIRFPGLYLALATLGFGLLLQSMFYSQSYLFGPLGFGLQMPRPHLSWLSVDSDTGYYYVVLAFAVMTTCLVIGIGRSRLGRLLKALADSPTGVRACGASINVSRVLVFCLSASLAAVAGALDGVTSGIVGGDGYQPIVSLQLFALIMLTVGDAPWYVVFAAIGQVLAPAYISTGPTVGYALTTWFGINAVFFAISRSDPSLPLWLKRFIDRARPRRSQATLERERASSAVPRPLLPERDLDLVVDGITVRYGGVVAVDNIHLTATSGKVTGLIGPNGAGKTTIFSACSGIVRPTKGMVSMGNQRLSRAGTAARARRGLGRTFQQMELFESCTVRENVSLGFEGHFADWNPLHHLVSWRSQRALTQQRANYALSVCGLDGLAERTVSTLSTGQRRLVELARCIAGDFGVLLLDEPSSGLDRIETVAFGEILHRLKSERNLAILLVEHDMMLVSQVCDYIYVLDFGKQLFEGTIHEVQGSAEVRAAYLGREDIEVASGVTAGSGAGSS
jgi:ABC-type branched-subunit amino acid transport system ATPase component/ABC-type branched-subunit amino acid transport system permease subunit